MNQSYQIDLLNILRKIFIENYIKTKYYKLMENSADYENHLVRRIYIAAAVTIKTNFTIRFAQFALSCI